ncbi:hypothetical protein D3C71_1242470 [compost metagenome]
MVGHHHERRALAGAEGLGQRHAAVRAERPLLQGGRGTGRGHPRCAVDDADPDRVLARALAGVDEAPVGTGAAVGIERVDQLGDRRLRAVAVVFQFHQGSHVGAEGVDGGDQLGLLRLVFGQAAGTAQGREAAALAVAVEEVFQVEGGHAQGARHHRHRRTIQRGQHQRAGHLQARGALGVHPHDAFHVAQDHAGAQVGAGREVGHLAGIAGVAAVIEQQAAVCIVSRYLGMAGAVRCGHFAGLPEASVEGHAEFAEAGQPVGAGQGQRRGDAHLLAVQGAPVGGRGGQGDAGLGAGDRGSGLRPCRRRRLGMDGGGQRQREGEHEGGTTHEGTTPGKCASVQTNDDRRWRGQRPPQMVAMQRRRHVDPRHAWMPRAARGCCPAPRTPDGSVPFRGGHRLAGWWGWAGQSEKHPRMAWIYEGWHDRRTSASTWHDRRTSAST